MLRQKKSNIKSNCTTATDFQQVNCAIQFKMYSNSANDTSFNDSEKNLMLKASARNECGSIPVVTSNGIM